ncbi:putative alpha/beta hydrolase fold protein [Tanacetum coccineum]
MAPLSTAGYPKPKNPPDPTCSSSTASEPMPCGNGAHMPSLNSYTTSMSTYQTWFSLVTQLQLGQNGVTRSKLSVKKVRVVGLSYGGFVAYSMAVQFKEMVERVVICCAGVCLEMKDLDDGLFPVRIGMKLR